MLNNNETIDEKNYLENINGITSPFIKKMHQDLAMLANIIKNPKQYSEQKIIYFFDQLVKQDARALEIISGHADFEWCDRFQFDPFLFSDIKELYLKTHSYLNSFFRDKTELNSIFIKKMHQELSVFSTTIQNQITYIDQRIIYLLNSLVTLDLDTLENLSGFSTQVWCEEFQFRHSLFQGIKSLFLIEYPALEQLFNDQEYSSLKEIDPPESYQDFIVKIKEKVEILKTEKEKIYYFFEQLFKCKEKVHSYIHGQVSLGVASFKAYINWASTFNINSDIFHSCKALFLTLFPEMAVFFHELHASINIKPVNILNSAKTLEETIKLKFQYIDNHKPHLTVYLWNELLKQNYSLLETYYGLSNKKLLEKFGLQSESVHSRLKYIFSDHPKLQIFFYKGIPLENIDTPEDEQSFITNIQNVFLKYMHLSKFTRLERAEYFFKSFFQQSKHFRNTYLKKPDKYWKNTFKNYFGPNPFYEAKENFKKGKDNKIDKEKLKLIKKYFPTTQVGKPELLDNEKITKKLKTNNSFFHQPSASPSTINDKQNYDQILCSISPKF